MATPQALAKILMAGGNLWRSSKKRSLCKAFREAAKEWCDIKKAGGSPGRFNDRFYQRLTANNPALAGQIAREVPVALRRRCASTMISALAGQIAREVPVLFQAGANAAQVGAGALVGTAPDIIAGVAGAGVPGASSVAAAVNGPVAGIMGTMTTGSLGVADGAAFQSLRNFFGTAGSSNFNLRFLDGQLPDGQVLEIKGPNDSFMRRPGEAVDQCKVKGKRPCVVSCKSCQPAACTVTKGGYSKCT